MKKFSTLFHDETLKDSLIVVFILALIVAACIFVL